MKRIAAICVAILLMGLPATSGAEVPIVDEEDVQFSLSGYLLGLTGIQHLTYDTGPLVDTDTIGLSASTLRLKWKLNLGELFTLELQNRFFWQLTSDPVLLGSALGLGATTPPLQTLDLRSEVIDRDTHLFIHDIDRLVLRFYTDAVDLTVGRQAITWGRAVLFTVSDLWTTFSPFEIDTAEKPGVDAIRALTSVADGEVELDFLLVERGALRELTEEGVDNTAQDLSGGVRMTAYLDFGDVSAAIAKNYEELMLLTDLTWTLDTWTLRSEASWVAWDLDDDEVLLPRITLGADYFGLSDFFLAVEYHFNGLGELKSEDYLQVFQSQEFGRGELYYVGQHYLGTVVTWNATDLLDTTLVVVGNLTDPSVLLLPQLLYRLSNEAELSAGAYVAIGESPNLVDDAGVPLPSPSLGSEFGTYGNLYFVQLTGYF